MNPEALISQCAPFSALKHDGLQRLYTFVRQFPIPSGAVVQCGVTNGGSAVLLWHACGGQRRHLWMFDSWQGLPEPRSDKDGGKASAKYIHMMTAYGSWCKGSVDKCMDIVRLAQVPEARTHCIKGWFADTLPAWAEKIGPIAMLHLDADWYQSTLECLTYLYPLLVPGGLLMLDDYGYWPGCDEACREYGIGDLLTVTPPSGAWLVKE